MTTSTQDLNGQQIISIKIIPERKSSKNHINKKLNLDNDRAADIIRIDDEPM